MVLKLSLQIKHSILGVSTERLCLEAGEPPLPPSQVVVLSVRGLISQVS